MRYGRDRVLLVGLWTTRHLLDIVGVHEPDGQSANLEQIHKRKPVVGGRLDDDPLHPLRRPRQGT
jgi:hypothetical protein